MDVQGGLFYEVERNSVMYPLLYSPRPYNATKKGVKGSPRNLKNIGKRASPEMRNIEVETVMTKCR
jgi:hypothetical protein